MATLKANRPMHQKIPPRQKSAPEMGSLKLDHRGMRREIYRFPQKNKSSLADGSAAHRARCTHWKFQYIAVRAPNRDAQAGVFACGQPPFSASNSPLCFICWWAEKLISLADICVFENSFVLAQYLRCCCSQSLPALKSLLVNKTALFTVCREAKINFAFTVWTIAYM